MFFQIGQYDTLMYKWAGVKLTVHKRHEHLDPELVKELKDKSKKSSGQWINWIRNKKKSWNR